MRHVGFGHVVFVIALHMLYGSRRPTPIERVIAMWQYKQKKLIAAKDSPPFTQSLNGICNVF